MFKETAELYDVLYQQGLGKDYATEATKVADLIDDRRPGARTLLDVACGTGLHLVHLAERFDCVGVDLDGGMLAVARRRLPTISFVEADMGDFDLGQRFDAVTCLFSSIAYAVTEERLRVAVAAMARHLEPGGVLVVEPFLQPEDATDGHLGMLAVDLPDLKVTRVNSTHIEPGNVLRLDFHYLVARDGRVEHRREEHRTAMFTWAQLRGAFEAAGLETEIDETGIFGRGLVVGVSPSAS